MFIVRIRGTDSKVSPGAIIKAVEAGMDDFDIDYDRIQVSWEPEKEIEDGSASRPEGS
jgi:hypothetical protein